MSVLSRDDSDLVRIADQILNEELLDPHTLAIQAEFTDIEGMRKFVVAAQMSMDITRAVDETREALRIAAGRLVKAHEAATAIVVDELEQDQINEFTAKLEALNSEIEQDDDFHTALALSQALVTTLKNLG